MNRLIVSMTTSIGIRGRGVPCGRKWAREAFVLWRNPRTTVPAHRGMAMPRFIDNCVVGVNEWGRSPSKFVVPMNKIRDISIRVQVWPLGLWIAIICFDVMWINHCWIAMRRLLTSRFVEGNRIVGNTIIRITMGRPIIVGVMKEANRFSFIWLLRGCHVLMTLLLRALGWGENSVLKLLVVL